MQVFRVTRKVSLRAIIIALTSNFIRILKLMKTDESNFMNTHRRISNGRNHETRNHIRNNITFIKYSIDTDIFSNSFIFRYSIVAQCKFEVLFSFSLVRRLFQIKIENYFKNIENFDSESECNSLECTLTQLCSLNNM